MLFIRVWFKNSKIC